jgi:hypothetical protein
MAQEGRKMCAAGTWEIAKDIIGPITKKLRSLRPSGLSGQHPLERSLGVVRKFGIEELAKMGASRAHYL